MSLKDLFGNTSEKIVTNTQLQDLYNQAESEGFLEELVEDKQRYLPSVDFSDPANFCFYGSAEKYYVDGITNIYQNYPYDGSKKEKQLWRNDSSQLDNYIFDNIYPKTTGYVQLSASSPVVSSNIRSSSIPQYVFIKGGPNAAIDGKFENSNIYDVAKNRESNLGITELGNTVEFWFKDNVPSGSGLSQAEYCLFDLWNGNTSGSGNYTRLTIRKINSSNIFSVSYVSGTSGIVDYQINHAFDPYNWHHYAFTFKNSDTNIQDLDLCLYIDGNFIVKNTIVNGGGILLANNANTTAHIGSYIADSSGVSTGYYGLGCSIGSYDEFRFWKIARTSREIYRNWFTSVGGGSNTDDSNANLGVYFKFNEGIVDTSAINSLDAVCLDYSGRISNGAIVNYNLNCKSTGSAIDEYFVKNIEEKDPIVFSTNPLVSEAITIYQELGVQYDLLNNSSIYKKLPSWITEEAEKENYPDLQRLVQIISSYFDTLHLQISKLSSVKDIEYSKQSDKPKPFYSNILASHGFDNLEIFNNTTFLEEVLSRNESSLFEEKINNIKNIIYQNIYNNLSYIYKSKGTEKSFRNLIRSFGIDNELVKINLYANNAQYDFNERYNYTSVAKKFADFNTYEKNAASIIQKKKSGDNNTRGYISGDNSGKLDFAPITVQAEILFPKKPSGESNTYYYTDYTDVSLFGCHTADPDDSVLSWHNNDVFNFQVYAIKSSNNSTSVYFKLTGSLSGSGFNLTSSVYTDVYENQKWNLAVRIKPEKYGYINYSSGSEITDYTVEFVGFNSILDTTNEEPFILSCSVPKDNAQAALRENKRLYAGAHYDNYNSSSLSLLSKTDVKISSVRFWLDYLDNDELRVHSFDASNYGIKYPRQKPQFINDSLILTRADMLLLNWSFDKVTGSDANGKFVVDDASSGSLDLINKYGVDWLGSVISYQHCGEAFNFPQSDIQVANKEYIYSAKSAQPETFNGSDMIQTPLTDDLIREKTSKPVSFYFSIEKSMAQVINDEILNWFATITNFNNLIGQPNDRYKKEYSGLVHLRKLFFEKVNNEPDYEKFLEFYKWIDSSISMMIGQLAPASANISNKVRNIVENTILDRNKYENKLSLIDKKDAVVPIAGNINNFSYPSNKAPASPGGPLWYKKRAIRTEQPYDMTETVNTPLEPQNDIDREIIRQVLNYSSYGKPVRLYDAATDQLYEGKKDQFKSLSKSYSFSVDRGLVLEGKIIGNNISNVSSSDKFIFAEEAMVNSSNQQIINPETIKYSIVSTPSLYDIETSSSYTGTRKTYKNIFKYKNPYEYFQTSGRSVNNKAFIDNEGKIQGNVSINPLGIVERELPKMTLENGKPNKTVFVERFSAPGGSEVNCLGALDPVAMEFSPYNELNNRNFRVRTFLNKWMLESSSKDENNPSYHKVVRNTAYYPGDDNNTTVNIQTDNGFISHAIPRSDTQYSWITSSVSGNTIFSGYDSNFNNINKNMQFLSGTVFIDSYMLSKALPELKINFSKYNIVYHSITNTIFGDVPVVSILKLIHDTASYTTSYITSTGSNQIIGIVNSGDILASNSIDLNAYLLNLNGPYGYPSWKQIRNYENPLVKTSIKNNIINVKDGVKIVTAADARNSSRTAYIDPQTFTSYREPPIEYNAPMLHSLDVSGSTGSIGTLSTYDNNINKFANESLMLTTNTKAREDKQAHDVMLQLQDGAIKPEIKILTASYTSQVFPSKLDVGLKETRTKPDYMEISGTGSNGYDRDSTKIRSFWRDSELLRRRSNAYETSNNYSSLNNFNLAQAQPTYNLVSYVGYPRTTSSVGRLELTSSKYYNVNYDSFFSLDNSSSYNGSAPRPGSVNVFLRDNLMGDISGFDEVEARNFFAVQSGTYFLQDVTKSSQETEKVEYFVYSNQYGIVLPKASYANKIHYPSITSLAVRATGVPVYNRLNLYFNSVFINEGMSYKTNILAGKNPWYDNYEEYFEDMRGYSKNMSIIPEFIFGKYDDYYSKVNNLNSLKAPDEYLSIPGSDILLDNSPESYNISDKIDNFIFNDLESQQKKIKITISGIKKLLPYKGFYPQERTAQIAGQFIKSYFGDISTDDLYVNGFPTAKHYFDNSGSTIVGQIQSLLQPYFAPGILFNTIKSGIAVDWPIINPDQNQLMHSEGSLYGTASFLAKSSLTSSVFVLDGDKSFTGPFRDYNFASGTFTSRLPFESLLTLEGISTDFLKTLPYLDPTRISTESFSNGRIVLDGPREYFIPSSNYRYPLFLRNNKNNKNNKTVSFLDNKYELAINNFLAEIPNFFLQNKTLTTFKSALSIKQIKFKVGKCYEMFVEISKDEDFKLLLDTISSLPYIFSSSNIPPDYYTVTPITLPVASVFGPPCRYFVGANGSEYYLGHKAYDSPAYAPYAPPYYYGKQQIKLSFIAQKEKYDSYQEIINILTASTVESQEVANYFYNACEALRDPADVEEQADIQYTGTLAYANRMTPLSSIRYDLIDEKKILQYEPNSGIPQSVSDGETNNDFWKIQTKFETPALNFNTDLNKNVNLLTAQDYFSPLEGTPGEYAIRTINNIYKFGFTGMWGGYAVTGSEGGISMQILDGNENDTTSSLASLCKFSNEKKYIGRVADNNKISEAVVMIPFLRTNPGGPEYAETFDMVSEPLKKDFPFPIKLMSIDTKKINKLLGFELYPSDPTIIKNISYNNIKKSLDNNPLRNNSIIQLMQKMTNYVLPPHLNWIYNRNIKPFVMYIFEFEHTLDGADLADIWQGLLPKIGTTAETQSVTIEHPLTEQELFEGKKLPNNIEWKIFKVKKKAHYKYDTLLTSEMDEFTFKDTTSTTDNSLVYSYNWPYDYFSLVELVNVKASLETNNYINKVMDEEELAAIIRQQEEDKKQQEEQRFINSTQETNSTNYAASILLSKFGNKL